MTEETTKATHTRGPWTEDSGDSDLVGVFDADGRFIAYLAEPSRTAMGGYVVERSAEETRANARLLSAAPDLFHACQMIDWATFGITNEKPVKPEHAAKWEHLMEARKLALAAIAKASTAPPTPES